MSGPPDERRPAYRPLDHRPPPSDRAGDPTPAEQSWDSEAPPPPRVEPYVRRRRSAEERRRGPRGWKVALAVLGALILLLALAGGALAVFRYLPKLDEARSLRADVEAMGSRIQAAGIGIDRTQLEALEGELDQARGRLEDLEAFLADDPLVGFARGFGPTQADVAGADSVVQAANHLFDATEDGLLLGRRFVEIKERQAANPAEASSLALIVETMATSREFAVDASAELQRAREVLAAVPEGLAGPIESARGAMVSRLDTYGPLLDAYVEVGAHLPDILGWSEPKRYLVLTQNPTELRPTGGLIGSYGLVTFDRGRISERTFQDVATLDLPWDFPFIEPPQDLANYLLGQEQPWQLADANWSPHFPTAAQDALRLYVNESGDDNIDGVLAITTYTIDELLQITGPITVPDYDVTIAAGETTLKVLERTREAEPGSNRKAILSALADELIPTLLAVPPAEWADLMGRMETLTAERLLLAWFEDPAHQALVAQHGFDGGMIETPGDYLYPVDSNVAPASKLHFVSTRSLDLDVQIDEVGNANNALEVIWSNGFNSPAWDTLRDLPNVGGPNMGVFFRLYVPERSRVVSVSGGSYVELTNLAALDEEAGRTVMGNHVILPPGETTLRYAWISPYPADADADGGTYRLVIQKQPGLLPGPVSVTITVPPGFLVDQVSAGVLVSGRTATLSGTFDRDVVLEITYRRANNASG